MNAKRVLVCPQAFKGSIDAQGAAEAISQGLKRVWNDADVTLMPIADGGDGTLDVLMAHGGRRMQARASDPLGRPITVEWGIAQAEDDEVAVLDLAKVSGLALLAEEERNPALTSTYGFGELFAAALDKGCRSFLAGIGGSATNDGGAGMAQALGARFLDSNGAEVRRGGAALNEVARIDAAGMDGRLAECTVRVMCDVVNPLFGPQGAATVYGPQKGATPRMVAELDKGLRNLDAVMGRDLGVEVAHVPGAGAAGGLGAGMMAFLKAELRQGAELVLDAIGFDRQLRQADLLVVGEGRFDASSVFNKAPVAAARRAKRRGLPVIGIGGKLGEGHQQVLEHGVDALFALTDEGGDPAHAMANAAALISDAAERAARSLAH